MVVMPVHVLTLPSLILGLCISAKHARHVVVEEGALRSCPAVDVGEGAFSLGSRGG